MAKTTEVHLQDDLDGSIENVSTISFAIDGVNYEIDLNNEHETQLRESLAPFIEKARRIPRTRRTHATSSAPKRSKEELTAIREWAKENGVEVSERGRIAQSVFDAYDAR